MENNEVVLTSPVMEKAKRTKVTTVRKTNRVEVNGGDFKAGVGKVGDLVEAGYHLVHQRHDAYVEDWDGKTTREEVFYALLEKEE